MTTAIRYWNRAEQREETEQVYGDAGVRFFYENRLGQCLADHVLSGILPSKLYGFYQDSRFSRKKIDRFVRDFKIPMNEFQKKEYSSFNDFFVRQFVPGARHFVSDPKQMAAFAEARYLAYEKISLEQTYPVKGADLQPAALLGREDIARPFEGGPLLIARLCPLDYHRFHYPDSGRTWDSYRIHGKLHSVNPVALKYRSDIFFTNERQVSLLDTVHFGRIAYIEVGAMAVGRIVQTHVQPQFERGDEKGYFLFGGSTVIVMGEAGAWKPAHDLLAQTAQNRETLVRLGDVIGLG
jgi:phosphatidylserine decarboxylase